MEFSPFSLQSQSVLLCLQYSTVLCLHITSEVCRILHVSHGFVKRGVLTRVGEIPPQKLQLLFMIVTYDCISREDY